MDETVVSVQQVLVRKGLVILLCGMGGYIAYPYFLPSDAEPSAYVAAPAPAVVVSVEAPAAVVAVMPPKFANIRSSASEAQKRVVDEVPVTELEPREVSPFDGEPLVLVGTQSMTSDNLQRDEDLLMLAVETGKWLEYRGLLQRSMASEFSKISLSSGVQRFNKVWSESRYYQCLVRWKVLGQFSGATLAATSENPESAAFMQWLMKNNVGMEELLITLTDSDDAESVFRFMGQVWKEQDAHPELAEKYFNLALACAVVFDQKLAYKNETSFGKYVDGLSRYRWYVDKNEGGLTEVSIDRSSARDLVFVVCSPVSEKELDWALRKLRSMRRKSWAGAYSMVEYLMERAVNGLNPYAEYTLPEILEEGGICGDQSYFCVNTARAAGIPAFTLVGETNLGGHAWAAVKIKPEEWSTTVGRIGGVSNGKGNDPQSKTMVSEQEVWLWSTREHQRRSNVVNIQQHLWLASSLLPTQHREEMPRAIHVAHQIGLQFPELWKRVYQVMLADELYTAEPKSKATLKLWTEFTKALRRQFKKNPRMASLAETIEDKHIFPYEDLAEVRRQMARARRRNDRDAQEQADLVTASLKRESLLLISRDEEEAFKEIGQLYDRALRDFGGSVSGFRTMSMDYFTFVKGDEKAAKKAVQDIDLSFKRVIETGSKDWFRAKAEVGLHRMICRLYREIGEEKRAVNMEKRLQRQLDRAKRGAL